MAAVTMALAGFFLPQEVPLEWYPLNEPGTDINYLEISCAANVNGNVAIYYDVALKGNRPIDNIIWPISPTTQTYTYTFPLPDAPIVEMRVNPPVNGELSIRQMRIINRRNEEVRRFTYDLFRPLQDIAAITPTPDGWKLVATPNGIAPSTRIELFSPIIPVGKDHRNLLRCLLSTGYLTLMLWILLLAVMFAFHRPAGWRDLLKHLGFLAIIAALFAVVGNRGLIRNSIDFARFTAMPVPPGLKLEFDVVSSGPAEAQVFWDSGDGFTEAASVRTAHEPHQGQQTLRFAMPANAAPFRGLRFDPRNNEGSLLIRGIRLIDAGQRTRAVLPLAALQADREIARLVVNDESVELQTAGGAKDPITTFTSSAVELVNRTLAADRKTP